MRWESRSHTPASATKQHNFVLMEGRWCHSEARKVTAGLASNWTRVTDFVVCNTCKLKGLRYGDEHPRPWYCWTAAALPLAQWLIAGSELYQTADDVDVACQLKALSTTDISSWDARLLLLLQSSIHSAPFKNKQRLGQQGRLVYQLWGWESKLTRFQNLRWLATILLIWKVVVYMSFNV